MPAMLTEDYLIRMINLALAALARLAGLKGEGQYERAKQEAEKMLEEAFGLRFELLQTLSDRSFIDLALEKSAHSAAFLLVAGQLFQEQAESAEALGLPSEASLSRLHALALYLEAALNEEDLQTAARAREKVDALLPSLKGLQVPVDTRYALFCHLENAGRFASAAEQIEGLQGAPGMEEAVRDELRDFYHRMAEKTETELEKGGLTREAILVRLKNLDAGQ